MWMFIGEGYAYNQITRIALLTLTISSIIITSRGLVERSDDSTNY